MSRASEPRAPRVLPLNHLQGHVVFDPARFKVVVCGRRWGKTWTGRTWLTQVADTPGRLWYVAPTYTIAHDIIWRELLETIPPDWHARKPNQTRLEMELRTGALMQLKGADDPDSLRGRGVKRAVIDEYADMPDIWDEILRPALADTGGEAMFLGTPKGYNHFHQLYKRGLDGQQALWRSWRFPTSSAPHFQTERGLIELAQIKASTPPHIWRQEYEAEFEARAGMIVGPLWEPSHTVSPEDRGLLLRGYALGQRVPWHVLDDPRWVPPSSWRVYGSVDYGYGVPFSFHLHALGPDGHVRTFAELYGSRILDHDQARLIRELILRLERDHGVARPEWIVADPAMFNARTDAHAKAITDIYREELDALNVVMMRGASGRPARLSRPQRWLDALSVAPDGWPWWSCTTACPALIRTVPEVPWDEDDPNVEDDDSENHCFEDCGRYFEARPVRPKTVAPVDAELAALDPLSRAEAERLASRYATRKVPKGGVVGFGGRR